MTTSNNTATQVEAIINQINELSQSELVDLNNAYCDACNMHDSYIYRNDEDFFSTFYPNANDGLRVAQAVFYGDYNYSHDYVTFNGYGNLQSYSYIDTDKICELVSVIAEYIAENPHEFSHILELDELL